MTHQEAINRIRKILATDDRASAKVENISKIVWRVDPDPPREPICRLCELPGSQCACEPNGVFE